MGRGAALPRRSTWTARRSLWFLMAFLLLVWRIAANSCPTHCICNVTMHLFYHVSCERSSMVTFPRELPSTINTTWLSMKWNNLTILQENYLDNFTKLQWLNLDYNKLAIIEKKAFHQCPHLKLLSLAHNNLQNLDSELFQRNTYLQYVDLSYNNLILSQPFLKSNSLVFLNMTATDLSEISVGTFSEMPNIQRLELNNNLLTTVNVKSLVAFVQPNVTVLMAGNPLHCDCELKKTREWVVARALPPAPAHTTACDRPEALRRRPWGALAHLNCGPTAGHTSSTGTVALYAIAGLLVVIATLVGLLVWGVRRRRRQHAADHAGRRKHRLAPPVGEYIDVLADAPRNKEPIYDTLPDPKKDPQCSGKVDADVPRYVTDLARNTYLSPVKLNNEGPIYVNMSGPPLPLRRPSDVPPAPREPAPAAPAAQGRPCSNPLLEGCDFYEVVD